ncbi:hypothetical protein FB45DRAFT_871574 [Roridomyces roridus]|uniref:Uncharacterized protein n=1 Tax=Roridomyces roridus TaxID=1738132 RepID=A0AAD7BFD2_9AGAR|nr:hypothetical protein FB45DRAFT_871574 [Roridomyces roridus]
MMQDFFGDLPTHLRAVDRAQAIFLDQAAVHATYYLLQITVVQICVCSSAPPWHALRWAWIILLERVWIPTFHAYQLSACPVDIRLDLAYEALFKALWELLQELKYLDRLHTNTDSQPGPVDQSVFWPGTSIEQLFSETSGTEVDLNLTDVDAQIMSRLWLAAPSANLMSV